MAEKLCQSLYVQFVNSFELLRNTISQFTPNQWLRGDLKFQVPAKISVNILDALDYYFRKNTQEKYTWGHRFGGGWWQLKDSELPSPQDLLNYLDELEERVQIIFFKDLNDADFYDPFDEQSEFGDTQLEHFVYAPRHTMHHHGALSLLSLQFENPEGIWK